MGSGIPQLPFELQLVIVHNLIEESRQDNAKQAWRGLDSMASVSTSWRAAVLQQVEQHVPSGDVLRGSRNMTILAKAVAQHITGPPRNIKGVPRNRVKFPDMSSSEKRDHLTKHAFVAAKEHLPALLQVLIDLGASVKNHGMLLRQTIRAGDARCVQVLLSAGALEEPSGSLNVAVREGQFDMTRMLLDHGADPDRAEPESPLLTAITTHNSALVRLLLDRGAHPDSHSKNRYSPLSEALRADDAEMINHLLEKGAVVVPLHYRWVGVRAQWTNRIFSHDTNPNKYNDALRESFGGIPQEEFVRHCVSNGADLNAVDRGITLLSRAMFSAPQHLELLLNLGADPNPGVPLHQFPLFIACDKIPKWGMVRVQILQRYGASFKKHPDGRRILEGDDSWFHPDWPSAMSERSRIEIRRLASSLDECAI